MSTHLRVARPVTDLTRAVAQYRAGLGLDVVGEFADHDGFDGVMLGRADASYHLEFTVCRMQRVIPTPTHEDLLVFYVPEQQAWIDRCEAMRGAGFREVAPYNPYWRRAARTFEDDDGYRVVIAQRAWQNAAAD